MKNVKMWANNNEEAKSIIDCALAHGLSYGTVTEDNYDNGGFYFNENYLTHSERNDREYFDDHEFEEFFFATPVELGDAYKVFKEHADGCIDDMVNHPNHYTNSPAKCSGCGKGIECIDVTRHQNFNLGNATKYIWRCDLKKDAIEDLKKAVFYLNDEIALRESKQ